MTNETSPCIRHGCHACCLGTEMTLTEADVMRLEARGHTAFTHELDTGDLALVNVDGHCVFLCHGRCSVYPDRPQGCRLYPLVLDLDLDRVVLDSFCPFSAELRWTDAEAEELRRSVACETREAAARRARRQS